MRDAGAVQEHEMSPRGVTLAGWLKGTNITTSTPLFTPCSPSVPALSLSGVQLGGLGCSQGDRLLFLIFAQTLPSPSWQLIKLLEPSLESEHGRPVPGTPSGELPFPGSLRMGRHRISHCSAWHSLGQRLGSPTQDGSAALQGGSRLPSWSLQEAWLRREQIQWAQDLPSPSCCPSHPRAQQEPLANIVTLSCPQLCCSTSALFASGYSCSGWHQGPHTLPWVLGANIPSSQCPRGAPVLPTAVLLPARQQVGCVLTVT